MIAPAMQGAGKQQPVDWVEPVKGIAILLVIAYHSTSALRLPNYTNGEIGVDLFLFLSGFGIAYMAKAESLGAFMARRFLRVVPRYWLSILIIAIALRYVGGGWPNWTATLVHVVGAHIFIDKQFGGINYSWWFVPTIMVFYVLMLPIRGAILRREPWTVLAYGAIVSLLVAASTPLFCQPAPPLQSSYFVHVGLRGLDIYIGLALGIVWRGDWSSKNQSWLAVTGVIWLCAVLLTHRGMLQTPMVALAFLFLAIQLVQTSAAARATAAAIGVYSYELFLLHQPFILQINQRTIMPSLGLSPADPWQHAAGIVVGLLICAPIAVAVHHLPVERLRLPRRVNLQQTRG